MQTKAAQIPSTAGGCRAQSVARRAFTLVELLVVVSIIALLISILLPSLKKAREQTKTLKCLANTRAMSQGVQYYVSDEGGTLPGPLHAPIFRKSGMTASDGTFVPMNANTERPWFLLDRLGRYLSKTDRKLEFLDTIATCPTHLGLNPDSNFAPNKTINGYNNPSWSRPFHYLPNTYGNTAPVFYFGWTNTGSTWTGYMKALNPNENAYSYANAGVTQRRPQKIERINRVADEWEIGDAWWNVVSVFGGPTSIAKYFAGTWQLTAPNAPTEKPSALRASATDNSNGGSHNPLPRAPIHRFGTGTNLVYFDGHGGTFASGKDHKNWVRILPGNYYRTGVRPVVP